MDVPEVLQDPAHDSYQKTWCGMVSRVMVELTVMKEKAVADKS